MKTAQAADLITDQQLALFWRLFRSAWAANCSRTGTSPNIRRASDDWRHKILLEESGASSIKRLRKDAFDDVMLRLAIEAGSDREISYWSSAVERRYRFLITRCLEDMARLDLSRPYDWNYVVSTYIRSGLPLSIHDATASDLKRIFKMLETHRRRLRHRAPAAPF